MALDTLGGLKASIAAWATRTDLTDTIPDFIAWADQEMGRRLRSNFSLARADVAISSEFADQPADFGAIKTFRLDVTPRVKLGVTDAAVVEDLCAAQSTTTYPTVVAIEGDQFHFGPLFSSATTGKLLYFSRPAAMVADSDANAVLLRYPFLYLYGALEALFRYLEDDNNTDRYGAQFGALIESINNTEAKDAMSGPLAVQPGAGVVVA